MTSKTIQQALWDQNKARLLERIASTAPLPEKCPNCGYAKSLCVCDCPGCTLCGGSGRLKLWAEDADVKDINYGKTKQCPNMRKNILQKNVQAGKEIGGLSAYEVQTLDWSLVRPGISDGLRALALVRPAVQRGYGMGIMLGRYGQAKTLLLKIATAIYLRNGKKAYYVKLTKMLDDIRTAYDHPEMKMIALINKMEEWQSYDFLGIDEFDKSAETDWARDRIADFCDDRWVKAVREEALTIFAANFTNPKDIPGYIRSRIEDSRFSITDENGKPAPFVITLSGPDGRQSMPDHYQF